MTILNKLANNGMVLGSAIGQLIPTILKHEWVDADKKIR